MISLKQLITKITTQRTICVFLETENNWLPTAIVGNNSFRFIRNKYSNYAINHITISINEINIYLDNNEINTSNFPLNFYLTDIENIIDSNIRIITDHIIKENPMHPINKVRIINDKNIKVYG